MLRTKRSFFIAALVPALLAGQAISVSTGRFVAAEEVTLKNDFVLAMTGYHPDFDFLRQLGIQLAPPEMRPVCDPETLESNVAGVYLAGVIIAGMKTGEIFIENGRFHGQQIAADLRHKLRPAHPAEPHPAQPPRSPYLQSAE